MRCYRGYRAAAAALVVCAWSGVCAAQSADADNDPIEKVNRAIFKANEAIDHAVLRPVAEAYDKHVPKGVRQGVHNIVRNLGEPAVAVNDLLQADAPHAWQSVQRLAVNTTVGGAGAVDVAARWGLPARGVDFGETLARWGVGEGPYVMIPILGPSNLRDAVGTAADVAFNPLTWVGAAAATYVQAAGSGAKVVDVRARHLQDLDDLEHNSLDFYAALRSVYRQHREAEIREVLPPSEQAKRGSGAPEDAP
jgi:phospholipid-binding lipoprotein MlaA